MRIKIVRLILILSLIIGMLLSLTGCGDEETDSKKQTKKKKLEWGDLYIKVLETELEEVDESVSFGLLDFNNDDIPEMVVKDIDDNYKIYSIKNEKAEEVLVADLEKVTVIYDSEIEENYYAYQENNSENIGIITDDFTVKKIDMSEEENKKRYYDYEVKVKVIQSDEIIEVDEVKEMFDEVIEETEIESVNKVVEESDIDPREELEIIADEIEEEKQKEAKRLEEEKRKEIEEAERKSSLIEAGDYTLAYGDYACITSGVGFTGGTYTLNQDGTFSYSNDWTNVKNENYHDLCSSNDLRREENRYRCIWCIHWIGYWKIISDISLLR